MACNASKTPFMRIFAKRGYSAQANPKAAGKANEIQTTTLPNKLVVATAENHLPVSRVSILFRAGARNESYENLGTSHMLRIAAGLTTKKSTSFAITRNIQQIGGSLSVTSDREVIAYTIELTTDKLETGLKYLQDVATAPAFKPWELSDSIPRLRVDLASVPNQVRAVEFLHKAAYRNELGNSIFCPKHQIGKISSEALQHYVASNCTTNRCAVVGVGVDHRLLVGYAQNLSLESGTGKDITSKYYGGGELRNDRTSDLAHVAIAGEGGSLSNLKEAIAFTVLQYASGVAPATKRGNVNGLIGKAVTGVISNASLSISSLNAAYTDSGLFGFVLSTDARQIGKAIDAAVKALKCGSVSADDVARGKAQFKAALLRQHGKDRGLLSDIGMQSVLLRNVQSVTEIAAAIDAITESDVASAAKKVSSSKLSMGAVGNLSHVPYVSDL